MEMGDVRDRGIVLTAAGRAVLKEALASKRDVDGRRWTRTQVASESGIHAKTVSRFINGTHPVDETTARSITQVLRVPFESLEPFIHLEQIQPDKTGTLTENPFTYGPVVSADRFYGRARAIADLKSRLGAKSPQSINLVGLRRSGKTSLLHYVRSRPDEFFTVEQKPLLVLIDLQYEHYHTPIAMNKGLRQGIFDGTGEWPWDEDKNDDPYAIEDGLTTLRDSGVRLILILDELERIGKRLDEFQDWGEDLRAKASAGLVTLVIATGRSLGEVYERFSLTSPFANIFSKTVVGALETEVWQQLVLEGLPQVTEGDMAWVDGVSGGMAFYVQMAATMLWLHGDRAEAEGEFWFQAEERFGELWESLSGAERAALRFVVGMGGVDMGRGMRDRLARYGLVRSDGGLFSSVFGDWIKENGGAI